MGETDCAGGLASIGKSGKYVERGGRPSRGVMKDGGLFEGRKGRDFVQGGYKAVCLTHLPGYFE